MRLSLIAIAAASSLASCGQPAANPYPESARARFDVSCPSDSPVCVCTWDRLTRTMTYDEYEDALQRFRETGLMDPKVTRARTQCIERHRE